MASNEEPASTTQLVREIANNFTDKKLVGIPTFSQAIREMVKAYISHKQ